MIIGTEDSLLVCSLSLTHDILLPQDYEPSVQQLLIEFFLLPVHRLLGPDSCQQPADYRDGLLKSLLAMNSPYLQAAIGIFFSFSRTLQEISPLSRVNYYSCFTLIPILEQHVVCPLKEVIRMQVFQVQNSEP